MLLADAADAGRVALLATVAVDATTVEAVTPPIDIPPDVEAALATAIPTAPTNACLLYPEIPLVVVAEAGDRREVALKTVRVVPSAEVLATLAPDLANTYKNANPDVGDVVSAPSDRDGCTGGTPVGTPLSTGRTVLCGRAETAQEFLQCGFGTDQATAETLSWQWYVTAGTFPEVGGQGNAMGRSIEFEPPAEAFTLWAIVRDGRGGVAWTRRDPPAP